MGRVGWWWKQRVHRSWVIALGCGAFVLGVWGGAQVSMLGWVGLLAVIPLVCALWVSRVYSLPIVVVGGLILGLGYGSVHYGQRDAYASYVGQLVTLQGRIKEDPSKNGAKTSLQLDSIRINKAEYAGVVLVGVVKALEVKRGDEVTVQGALGEPFGSFPATMSVLKFESAERPVPGDVGRVVRDWFADQVREVIPDPQASLGIGFLTGQKSALPEDLSEALKIAGLTHIVVASGYNLTILVRMARKLFLKVSKYLSAVASAVMIVMFMAITGLSPSMTRAGLVSSLSLLAWYYGHAFHPFVLLPFAAAITVAFQPSYVWGDLGWQLSFAAFAGVMIVAPLLQRYFYGNKDPGTLRQILGETISAHIVTVPIIALSFGVVSNVAVIANLLVVPLVPLAMLLTFLCGLWSIVGIPFEWLLGVPTTWLLGYMTQVATFVSELSWAQSELSLQPLVWAGYLLVLVAACVWMQRATRYTFRGSDPIVS